MTEYHHETDDVFLALFDADCTTNDSSVAICPLWRGLRSPGMFQKATHRLNSNLQHFLPTIFQ